LGKDIPRLAHAIADRTFLRIMSMLGILKRLILRYIQAARDAPVATTPLHVCYALAMDHERLYVHLTTISAMCVRRIYPNSQITVLTDDVSLQNIGCELDHLATVGTRIRSIGRFDGSARLRSRFVKTQVRNVVDGDVLYLDADTAAVREFDGLLQCEAPLSAAIDRNRVDPQGGFPAWAVPDFDRLGWRHPTRLYLNAGIILWRDCSEARALAKSWHENWLRYTTTVDNPADQPAFNHSIDVLGIEPRIMDDVFNARVGVSPEFANGACIYHLLSGDERANSSTLPRGRDGRRSQGCGADDPAQGGRVPSWSTRGHRDWRPADLQQRAESPSQDFVMDYRAFAA
jgi:hypothetical protein